MIWGYCMLCDRLVLIHKVGLGYLSREAAWAPMEHNKLGPEEERCPGSGKVIK